MARYEAGREETQNGFNKQRFCETHLPVTWEQHQVSTLSALTISINPLIVIKTHLGTESTIHASLGYSQNVTFKIKLKFTLQNCQHLYQNTLIMPYLPSPVSSNFSNLVFLPQFHPFFACYQAVSPAHM